MTPALGQKSYSAHLATISQAFVPSPCNNQVSQYLKINHNDEEDTTHDEPVREAWIEWDNALKERYLLRGESYIESLHVLRQVLDTTTSDNREDVRSLLEMVGNRNYISSEEHWRTR